MKKLGILGVAGAIAAAVAVFGYSKFGGSVAENAEPAAPDVAYSVPAEKSQLKTRGLSFDLTQQDASTVCEKPSGDVCEVEPLPIDSRCECDDGSVGRIVR